MADISVVGRRQFSTLLEELHVSQNVKRINLYLTCIFSRELSTFLE